MDPLEQLRQTILQMGPVCPECGAPARVVTPYTEVKLAHCARVAWVCTPGPLRSDTPPTLFVLSAASEWFPHWEVRRKRALSQAERFVRFERELRRRVAENAELKQRIAELEAKAPRVWVGPSSMTIVSMPTVPESGSVPLPSRVWLGPGFLGDERATRDAVERAVERDAAHHVDDARILPLPKCTAVGCVHPVVARSAGLGLQLCAHHDRIAMTEQVCTDGKIEPVSKIEGVPGPQGYNPWDPEGQAGE